MEQQSQDSAALAPADLTDYTSVSDWLEQHAGPFFETRSALEWFVKRNRRELIERGALLPSQGRNGSLVSITRMPVVVVDILRRRALERDTA